MNDLKVLTTPHADRPPVDLEPPGRARAATPRRLARRVGWLASAAVLTVAAAVAVFTIDARRPVTPGSVVAHRAGSDQGGFDRAGSDQLFPDQNAAGQALTGGRAPDGTVLGGTAPGGTAPGGRALDGTALGGVAPGAGAGVTAVIGVEVSGLDAPAVLRRAAAAARREPVLVARPDQFVYVRSLAAWAGGAVAADGGLRYEPPVEVERQVWVSADGSREGLLKELPTDPWVTVVPDLGNEPLTGPADRAYRDDLPTTAAAMRAWLYREPNGGNPPDEGAFTLVGDALQEKYVPPAATAALFEAAATIPGVRVVGQIDLVGRRGIAVSRTDDGIRHDLIFDAAGYRFLGVRDVVVDKMPNVAVGTVTGWTAQLQVAIVDRPGQRP